MTELTPDRKLVFYDAEGLTYRPVRDGGSGRSIFKIKPKGAGNLAAEAIHTEEWLEVARAMLVDGLAARCQLLPRGQTNYLKFGAGKLVRYELDSSIAETLGIPTSGNAGDSMNGAHQDLLNLLTRREVDAAMRERDEMGLSAFLSRGGFVRPQVWIKGSTEDPTYPAKATVVAALRHLPNSSAISAKEFFNGFGESQAFSRLTELGYELLRTGAEPVSGIMSRASIEAAMDAYDREGPAGGIFVHFGEPRDFWVRSTRARPKRIYPTKPLVGYILGKSKINGGWGQAADAAAQLHNSGFLIVDENDVPVPVIESYSHLLRGRKRVQLCAINYYIEPAREAGQSEMTIRAGDLRAVLEERTPTICQALSDERLQKLGDVSVLTRSTPEDSRDTIFSFKLHGQTADQEETSMKMDIWMPLPTNLILYGPPGTGKTYRTAWEAVRLCEGEQVATELKGDNKRAALMAKYQQLVDEHRIEFVTFHQSMSYEEFVEGLRPVPIEEDAEGPSQHSTNSGFRLEPHDGVFKRVSENARINRSPATQGKRLDRSARVFKVALGNRQIEQERQRIRFGLDNNLIHVGWGGDINWSDERFDEFSEIFSEWKKKDPEATGLDGNVVITYSLRADMQLGDYVVVSDGRDRIQALGRVTGEYFYDETAAFHPHRRSVEWLWRDEQGTERSRFYPKTFRRHSIYKLNQSLVDWDALEGIVFSDEVPQGRQTVFNYVLIIDEINRANISKVLGELITLLEPDKRLGMANEIRLTLPYSKKLFSVPSNLHIIGTMNTADRSIALLDTALRRRFTFEELMPDPTVLSENVGGINLRKLLATINERVEYLFDREHQIGHAYFTSCQTRADVEEVMRHKVIPLLAEYFYEDWSRVAAVLGDTGQSGSRFLEARRLAAPAGLMQDDLVDGKQRWLVKRQFDFTEFHA